MRRVAGTLLAGVLLTSGVIAQESLNKPPKELPSGQSAPPATPTPAAVPETVLPANCFEAAPVSRNRWFLDGDYLLWWVKRAPLPAPLITTTRNLGEGLPAEFTGSLTDPATQSLIGGHDMNFGALSGLGLRAGVSAEPFTLELGGFLLERRSGGGDVAGDANGFPFIAQTFFDVTTGLENSYFISVPLFSTGSVVVSDQLKLFGAEANARF